MKLALILSTSLLVLLGCATAAKYEAVLNSWVGMPEIDLIRKWGPPQQSYDAGQSKFIVYNTSRNVLLPGTSPTYTTTVYGDVAYTTGSGGMPPQNLQFSCQTTFEITDGVIASWRWQGNDCTSL